METLEGLLKKVYHEENKTIMCRFSASVVSRIRISPVLFGITLNTTKYRKKDVDNFIRRNKREKKITHYEI